MNYLNSVGDEKCRKRCDKVRPVYFCVVVWGDRYVDYLLEYCIPSLLSSGNIPSLPAGDHKFLFATTASDRKAIEQSPMARELARFVKLEFLEINFPPPDRSAMLHMGVGHKLVTDRCFRDRAFGVHVTPDLVLSDGTVRSMCREAKNGARVYLCAALRFAEEPLFEEFRNRGHDRPGVKRSENGAPLVLAGRDLVQIAMHSMHSETASFEFDAPYFRELPSAVWWRVPEDGGMLIHCLSWCPLLLDYSIVDDHDVSSLDNWTLDGDYVHRNFHKAEKIYVCDDSDEVMLISWAPLAYNPVPLEPNLLSLVVPRFREAFNCVLLRRTLASPVFDETKKKLFHKPVRWHIGDIDGRWAAREARARDLIARPATRLDGMYRFALEWLSIGRLWSLITPYIHTFRMRIWPALKGDREMQARILRRLFRTKP